MKRPVVLLLGKVPPPYMGPAIATRILLDSSLGRHFRLLHLDTRAHRSLKSVGRWSFAKVVRTLLIYARLKLMILRYRPSVVVIPVSQSTLGYFKDSLYLLISKALFRRVILHLRGSDFRNWFERSPSPVQWWVRFSLKQVQGVIVQGEALRSLFDGLVKPERIHVVPNGADYPITPSYQRHLPFRILYLANLQASKGVEDLLEAVLILKNTGKKGFEVEVAGSWRAAETQRNCTEFVNRNSLPVMFRPAVIDEEKYALLQRSDVFVFPPRLPEGHPWVIVEAQAAGLPVIATAKGAIPEAVHEGRNGFIVPDRNPAAIADRLNRLMEQEELRLAMALESRKTYEEHYTEEAMVARMKEAIETVIRNNH